MSRLKPAHRRAKGLRIGAIHTCARKVAYGSQAAAEAAMAELRSQPTYAERPGKRLHVYRCPAARDHWHVGNWPEAGYVAKPGRKTA